MALKLITETVQDVRTLVEKQETFNGTRPTYFIEGIFMQGNTKNQNGRVYPSDTLEREMHRYQKEYIDRKRAFGELGHPECYAAGAKILTVGGVKNIADVRVDELVYAYDFTQDQVVAVPVLNVVDAPYTGSMIRFRGPNFDALVTPNHRFFVGTRGSRTVTWKTAQELLDAFTAGAWEADTFIPRAWGSLAADGDGCVAVESLSFSDMTTDNVWLDAQCLTVTEEEYSGNVVCVQNIHQNFYAFMEHEVLVGGAPRGHWTGNSPTVNLDRVSHMITELRRDGDNFYGKAKIMCETPMGKIVRALIDEDAGLGVSTRGLGSLRETHNGMEVQDDFFLSTVDIVADPSAPEAFVRGVMEGKAWVWEGGVLKECALETLVTRLDAAHQPTVSVDERRQQFVEAFSDYLGALRRGVRSNIQER